MHQMSSNKCLDCKNTTSNLYELCNKQQSAVGQVPTHLAAVVKIPKQNATLPVTSNLQTPNKQR